MKNDPTAKRYCEISILPRLTELESSVEDRSNNNQKEEPQEEREQWAMCPKLCRLNPLLPRVLVWLPKQSTIAWVLCSLCFHCCCCCCCFSIDLFHGSETYPCLLEILTHSLTHSLMTSLGIALCLQTAATRVMHDMPRFGHSRDFANLFASNEEQKDYIAGLLFAGIFLISIFLTFSVILLILKCFGPKRVGYLAGAPFVELPPASEQDLDAVVDEEKPKGKWKLCHKSKCCTCSPNVKRAIFCICTVILVIFSVLFVTNGLTNLRNTIVTVIDSSSVSTLNIGYWILDTAHITSFMDIIY